MYELNGVPDPDIGAPIRCCSYFPTGNGSDGPYEFRVTKVRIWSQQFRIVPPPFLSHDESGLTFPFLPEKVRIE